MRKTDSYNTHTIKRQVTKKDRATNKSVFQIKSSNDFVFTNLCCNSNSNRKILKTCLSKKAVHFIYPSQHNISIKLKGAFNKELICFANKTSIFSCKIPSNNDLDITFNKEPEVSILSMSYPFLETFGGNSPDIFLDNFQHLKSEPVIYFQESTGDKRISRIINKIKKYWNIEQPNNVLVKAAIAELQSIFMQQYLILNSDNILSNLEIQKIGELPGIIMDQIDTHLTSKKLASKVGIKIDRLELGCKIIFKCKLSALIDEIKLENVVNLLMTTNYSLADIAYQNGYTQRSYLYSVFLKRFNCSPLEYKDNYLKK